eukprot:Skav228349  [mRNA]  locus=scaffold5397:2979:3404:+ [translate_table: standard]
MHGLTELRGGDQGMRVFFLALSKVCLENIPQLALQTSFLALVFDQLTVLGRAKVLFSIVVGLASASQKVFMAMRELVLMLVEAIYHQWAQMNCRSCCILSVVSAVFMLAPMAVLWTVIKLYFIFHCETHLWNFGSGCVEWT